MSGGKSIVRDIHVSVARVDTTESASQRLKNAIGSSATTYVFAVRPLASTLPRCRQRVRPRRFSTTEFSSANTTTRPGRRYSDASTIAIPVLPSLSFVHEVARTYVQCRALYTQLLAFTDCRHADTCCCILGSCPFWSMYSVVKAFAFPRNALLSLQWTRSSRIEQRVVAFNAFMATICHHFQLYRDDFFLERSFSSEFHGCKVIAAIEEFLELTDDVVVQLQCAERRQQLKPNLHGWQSDRKNLYFYEEDATSTTTATTTTVEKSCSSSSLFDTGTDSLGVNVDAILLGLEDPTDQNEYY